MKQQLTNRIFMVRPKHFGFNLETEASNKFQKNISILNAEEIRDKALLEFDNMVNTLTTKGVDVDVFEDLPDTILPDSVFPNNWISTEENGTIYTYPMQALIRRQERREDIVEKLTEKYLVTKRYSLELFEEQEQYLEGTGSLILDRIHKIAYACLSPRTDPRVLHKFALLSGYQTVLFNAVDAQKNEIYHTNVMMAMGSDFVICCMESIPESQQQKLLESFSQTDKELVEISFSQMNQFAGNMLLLKNHKGSPLLVCSESAYNSLTRNQRVRFEKSAELVVIPLDIIETVGGGSARCMIAENFLPAHI